MTPTEPTSLTSPHSGALLASVRYRFDAYGNYQLVVERVGDAWRVLQIGADGKRCERADLAIPADYVSAAEIAEYLDVLLHESSKPGRALRVLGSHD